MSTLHCQRLFVFSSSYSLHIFFAAPNVSGCVLLRIHSLCCLLPVCTLRRLCAVSCIYSPSMFSSFFPHLLSFLSLCCVPSERIGTRSNAQTPHVLAVGIIAGTGSIAFGFDANGEFVRSGGWGPLMGDEGSGYKIALSGMSFIRPLLMHLDQLSSARVLFLLSSGFAQYRSSCLLVLGCIDFASCASCLIQNKPASASTLRTCTQRGFLLTRNCTHHVHNMAYLLTRNSPIPFLNTAALEGTMRAHDGRGEPTAISQMVLSLLGCKSASEIVTKVYQHKEDRGWLGQFAGCALEAAEEGDKTANAILDMAVSELALLVQNVRAKAGNIKAGEPYVLAVTGGVLSKSDLYRAKLENALRDVGDVDAQLHIVADPAVGCLEMAPGVAAKTHQLHCVRTVLLCTLSWRLTCPLRFAP